MFRHSLAFDSAGYLLLLLLIPLLWWLSFQSLSGLGRWRRLLALALRSLVLVLLVLALADVQYRRQSDQLTVVYLLDQSLSIPTDQRQAMIEYVNASIDEHHNAGKNDRYAVIAFAQDAAVEIPLVDTGIPLPSRIESILDPEYTDLATAIQRAKAMFPHDAAKRIVLVTDGNQNLGNAQREARSAAAAGVSIDVVPVLLTAQSEIAVQKVDIPAGVRRGQPFDLRVVLNNDAEQDGSSPVQGKLLIIRKSGEREELLTEQQIEVPPGKRVFTVTQKIDQADFFTYQAKFVPDDPARDGMAQNNVATAFTHVRGKGAVLLIENWDKPGQFDYLVERLKFEDIEVSVTPSDQLFSSLAELQRYDAVILANVPRSTGTDADNVSSFSDDQISMLVRNTREMGCGLIMMGGPDTFGAGGWINSELEKAMPVDFQIKSSKVIPVGALVLMMHAGEMPRANYWQKRVAVESIKMLGGRDYAGMVQWNGNDQWLWGASQGGLIPVGKNRKMMLSRIDRMSIGDMPAFDPALKMAAAAFAGVKDAAVKHMIIISDGDPTPPSSAAINALIKQQVRVSTVAVGSHGTIGSSEMQSIARKTGGKYYVVKSAKALPRIYQREARRVAQQLVFEPKPPVRPQVITQHEIVQGIEGGPPPISGFMRTSLKENPLVEVVLRSPLPVQEKNATVLAVWTYGAGKAVALTTDAGAQWANQWTQWEGYDKLFSQIVRWSMRPTDNLGNFSLATDVRDGTTQVVITALDEEEQFLNDQAMSGTVVAPDMSSLPLRIEQTAPGRYVGQFPSQQTGSYLIVINPGPGKAPIRTGINVGYSAEYRANETNLALLKSLAKLTAKDGPSGVLVESGLEGARADPSGALNPFRRDLPPAIANQSIWHWLVLACSCFFLADVFVRRVQVNLLWALPALAKARDFVLRRERAVPEPETMSRLQSRKQEVAQKIESRRQASRFETAEPAVEGSTLVDESSVAAQSAGPRPQPTQPSSEPTPDKTDELSYTERLLEAKRRAQRDREK